MSKKLLLIFCGFMLIMMSIYSPALFAQSSKKIKADKLFNTLAFARAIPLYHKVFKKSNDPDCVVKLAECYRLTKNYEQAAVWFEQAVALENPPPITWFHYGQTLLERGDHEEAKIAFTQYKKLKPDDPRGQAFLSSLEHFNELLEDSLAYTLRFAPFNSKYSDFSAWPYKDGFVFASSRDQGTPMKKTFDWLNESFLNLFFVKPKDTLWSKFSLTELLRGDINSPLHESNFTIADSGRAFFTRNNVVGKKGKKNDDRLILLKIYSAKMNGLRSSDIQEFPYNSEDYSLTHPCLSPDGMTLYFVSDMPGGEGGKDLYKSTLQDTAWSKPENLGKLINTSGDEMFPFIHQNGKLYFASSGHPGMGNLDLFYVELEEDEKVVRNMGYPLNSAYDDFGFFIDENEENGLFSSDRPGGKGRDDFYLFRIEKPLVEILVLDKVAQLPIENAVLQVKDEFGELIGTYTTDSLGEIYFTLDAGEKYDAAVMTTEFEDYEFEIHTVSEDGSNVIRHIVELYNPPPAITALVVDEESKLKIRDANIYLINLESNDTIIRTSDRNGRFAVKLENYSQYDMIVRKKGYLSYHSKVNTYASSFDGDTIIPMKLEKIILGAPVVLKNIYYAFNKATLQPESKGELQRLDTLLRNNPEIKIELSAHTDCRGSNTYNQQLSQKRAESAVDYLLSLGISEERIIANGYGEKKLVNKCSDGIKCSDEEHQANRRTEFTIIGYIKGIDIEKSILDTRIE